MIKESIASGVEGPVDALDKTSKNPYSLSDKLKGITPTNLSLP